MCIRDRLKGMKIVIDCANGAGYKSGPALLKTLGAKVISIGTKPNGLNINYKCGSTYPKKMQAAVKKHKAHLGISLDGDADRIIMCDEKGKIIDGDQIIAMLARRWKSKKILRGGVIGTLMSNYGLEQFLKKENIKFWNLPRYECFEGRTLTGWEGGVQSNRIVGEEIEDDKNELEIEHFLSLDSLLTQKRIGDGSVSYTHLTLPTICSV